MFINYIKVALRNILKQKSYSLINIAGLAIGMACAITILLWVQDELSYDLFHPNIDNLYRMYQYDRFSDGRKLLTDNLSGPLAEELITNYPEVENTTRFLSYGSKPVMHGDNVYDQRGIAYVDPTFLQMFDFPLLIGDVENVLSDPFSIVITEEMAQKYFGTENPIGKTLTIDNQYDFNVTGVLQDPPHNTHLHFTCLVNFDRTQELMQTSFDVWGWNWPRTYVLLKDGASHAIFEQKVAGILKEHGQDSATLHAQPVKNINLYTLTGERGYINYVYIFSLIAFFILIIACINFMNLSTARSQRRAREVGIRKVVGAHRSNLISQFIGESIFLSLLALIFALFLVELFIPIFNEIAGAGMKLDFVGNRYLFLMILGIAVITGVISGSYPAIFLSAFQPVRVLKGTYASGSKRSIVRNIMVVTQFTISIILIIGTMVIYRQINYMVNIDLGFNKDHLVYIHMRGDSKDKYETIKTRFFENPNILDVSATSMLPISSGNNSGAFDWEGRVPDQSVLINCVDVDVNYIEMMGMEMVEGESFINRHVPEGDAPPEVILNQSAIRQMGMTNPIGKRFGYPGNPGTIIGVVKDFHFETLRREIAPMRIRAVPTATSILLARISGKNITETVDYMQDTWKEINPSIPFVHHFFDETFEWMYRTEMRMSKLSRYFTVIAIFVACLGLFGLASYTVQQRTKEIGIRKVLGASVAHIAKLLSAEFIILVIVASAIACPVAYLLMSNWLDDFAYRIAVTWWILLFAGALAMIIAMITVSAQAIKAAITNPVKALRYE